MAVQDRYSRVIAWLKILLPLTALAILSTLFLVARVVEPAQELLYSDVDVAELLDQQMIGTPRYLGVTGNGVAVRLSAETVSPDLDGQDSSNAERFRGHKVRAEIDTPDGDRIYVYADRLNLDVSEKLATLIGNARMESSDDIVLKSEEMQLVLDEARIFSDRRIEVSAPAGHIVANSFQMKQKEDAGSDFVLVFKGDVTMHFDPKE